jgi:hypothetical protein
MAHKRLPRPAPLQEILEWRYPRAHRYWDDCGKLIAEIERTFPGLECTGLEPDGFKFKNERSGVSAAFYWDKSHFVSSQPGSGFPEACVKFRDLIAEGLSVEKTIRVGHRIWAVYPMDTRSAARILENAEVWGFADTIAEALGTPSSQGVVLRSRLEDGRTLRLEVGVGAAAKGHINQTGVLVDVDIARDGEEETSFDLGEFLQWNQTFFRERLLWAITRSIS